MASRFSRAVMWFVCQKHLFLTTEKSLSQLIFEVNTLMVKVKKTPALGNTKNQGRENMTQH